MESEKVVAEELPRAIVRRVMKDKLSECSPDYDVSIHKEALLAFAESARVFIHYLSATANDLCKESKRQTMNANDVLKALEEIDFPEFVEPLKTSLEEFKQKNAGKKSGGGGGSKPKETKKRKQEESSLQNGRRKSKPGKEKEENDDHNMDENGNEDGDNISGEEEDGDEAEA
ncbi:PREDICTED: DNA polymerase epsilon subunit 3 [Tarenaya hassleriana]|uniref:DNA polymerase epsilon subunit 3 n=1 Tax=Tarenaya hassleriana TaxID=28532 RepID=UPI00053C7A1E|nr:PREDICTED: DNA polymerase epsilon subunit 3 [Tarenaya hassleriana]